MGFAKTQGVELTALRIVETERGEYVAVSKLETGVPTREILKTLLTEWIEALRFPKTMRWEPNPKDRVRSLALRVPIRWLVALLGDEVVNCTYGAAHAGRLTYGHRALHPEPITLDSADLNTYVEKLRAVGVLVCPKERRDTIEKQVRDVLAVEG